MSSKSITAVSLFAGVGGVCQGLKNAGINVIWANEIDKNACITYRANHKSTILIEGDINNIQTDQIPDSDILTAGFPCQAFSIAGYRKGFDDIRGNLFFSIVRILSEKVNKPRIIFLENVKNLVSHDGGNTFEVIKNELTKLGYKLHYKVLNTAEYGNIPQNRERIFIIGFLYENEFLKFKFPDKIKLENTIKDFLEEQRVDDKYYYTENSPYYKWLIDTVISRETTYQIRRIYVRENKSNLCPTLTANMGTGGHNVPIIKDLFGIRKLTPKECFMLQGFPKNFNLMNMANSHLYKQAGNAVSVSVINRIAENIITSLSSNNSNKINNVKHQLPNQQCLL